MGHDEQDEDRARGRHASKPSQIPGLGWLDIALRMWRSINEDRVMLIAGGVTFYLLLALFPALAAFVSTYGLFADPATVGEHIAALDGLVPAQGLDIIRERLDKLVSKDSGTLGIGIAFGLALSFWSANNGVKAIFEALNIAYREQEKRSFIKLNLIALAFTVGAMLTAAVMITAIGIVPVVLGVLRLGSFSETLAGALRWPVLVALMAVGISVLYRYGPSREPAKWRWITWGAVFSTVMAIVASAGFSWYLQNFANYDATYGSLGAIIGFMVWTWISVIILVVGAELNAEMEHQTARDSTTGEAQPMGERGAVVADTLGRTSADKDKTE